MIYLKGTGVNVELAGEVVNQAMLDEGYIQYVGIIPTIGEYQHYDFDGTVLSVVDDNVEYSKAISKRIQVILDEQAQKFRYDDMVSARALAGVPLIGTETVKELTMHNESISLAQWYLKVWGTVSQIEQDVVDGIITRPTVDEVIAQLPLYV